MQDYLMRALNDDVDTLDLINVIRVITGKRMIHHGVSGEEHHGTKKMKARLKEESELEIELEENEPNEEVEIDEILTMYMQKG